MMYIYIINFNKFTALGCIRVPNTLYVCKQVVTYALQYHIKCILIIKYPCLLQMNTKTPFWLRLNVVLLNVMGECTYYMICGS